jgi:hypothetical protein
MKVELIYDGLTADEIMSRYSEDAKKFKMQYQDPFAVAIELNSMEDIIGLRKIIGSDLLITSVGLEDKCTLMVIDEDDDDMDDDL